MHKLFAQGSLPNSGHCDDSPLINRSRLGNYGKRRVLSVSSLYLHLQTMCIVALKVIRSWKNLPSYYFLHVAKLQLRLVRGCFLTFWTIPSFECYDGPHTLVIMIRIARYNQLLKLRSSSYLYYHYITSDYWKMLIFVTSSWNKVWTAFYENQNYDF